MYGFKKTLAMVMAILTPVLSCTVVFAEDAEQPSRVLIIQTGYYNGYS